MTNCAGCRQEKWCIGLIPRGRSRLRAGKGIDHKAFRWQRSGRWSKSAHDVLVNEFRLTVLEACEEANDELNLREWVPEGDFLINKDTISYKTPQGHTASRIMQPDGFFLVQKPSRRYPGKWATYAFLVEVDNSTESNVRFGRDKVPPGLADPQATYMPSGLGLSMAGLRWWRSARAGAQSQEQTERFGGGDLFYFTKSPWNPRPGPASYLVALRFVSTLVTDSRS